MSMVLRARVAVAVGVCFASVLSCKPASASGPVTQWHFAANANTDASGQFAPSAVGFNLADVNASADELNALPVGVKGLVWVGQCDGADAAFTSLIKPIIGNPKVYGFYLMDEPDPTGQWAPTCPQANLKAESDWIHSNDPGTKTFIVLLNMSSASHPSFTPTYTPANSDIDLYGVDPYPCRTELNGCDFGMIGRYVNAAESAGVPAANIVPVYQAFGGGAWNDDGGGYYQMPQADQESQIFSTWATLVPQPAFDYAYSWGSQRGDSALGASPTLQQVFAAHNQQPSSTSGSTGSSGSSGSGSSGSGKGSGRKSGSTSKVLIPTRATTNSTLANTVPGRRSLLTAGGSNAPAPSAGFFPALRGQGDSPAASGWQRFTDWPASTALFAVLVVATSMGFGRRRRRTHRPRHAQR
jgi:uncharacterized membrane protein YgcG